MPSNTSMRVLHTTRELWTKGFSNETIDFHPLLKLLQSKGKIKYGCTGTSNKWTVKYKQLPLQGYADMDVLTYERKRVTQVAELEWRGYKMVDAISELEMLQNEGGNDTQIASLLANKLEMMKEDANDQINQEFYIDGEGTGNTKRFHGILSFGGYTQHTDTNTLGITQSDTYAGLSTAYGAYGGSAGDPHYEFWTPIMVHAANNSNTWAANAPEAVRRGIHYAKHGKASSHRPDIGFCSRADYVTLLDLLSAKERLVVPTKGIAKFGFDDLVQIDGVDITFDPDMPTTFNSAGGGTGTLRCILFNTNQMELRLLGKKKVLWNASGDAFKEENMTKRFWIGLFGNLVFKSPRHFAFVGDLATSA